jgi:hypothetical protein
VRQLDYVALSHFGFFFGHISPAALPFLPSDLSCITMLREPRVRLLSAYAFWKYLAPFNPHNEFFRAIASLTLLQFLQDESPVVRRATWNVQARLLAGGHFGTTDDHRTNVFGPEIGADELADLAEEKLDTFTLVGATEHYAGSLKLACELLGLPKPAFPVTRFRSGATRETYAEMMADAKIMEAIYARTDIDVKVYATALRRLNRRLNPSEQRPNLV